MVSTLELAVYALLNFLPYALFLVAILPDALRFSRWETIAIITASSLAQVALMIIGAEDSSAYGEICSIASTILSLGTFVVVAKLPLRIIVFLLFSLLNIANFVVTISKFVEGIFFRDSVFLVYSWTFILCTIAVQAATLVPLYLYFRRITGQSNFECTKSPIFAYAWIIPVAYYLIWFYVSFHTEGQTSLERALLPDNALFNIFMLISQVAICSIAFDSAKRYAEARMALENQRHLSTLALQYQASKEEMDEVRKARHDLRHHIRVMQTLAEQQEFENLKRHLDNMSGMASSTRKTVYTNIAPLDAILGHVDEICHRDGISFTVDARIPPFMPLNDIEVAAVFGNLLENAVQAARAVPEGPRKITFRARTGQGKLLFAIDNTFANEIKRDRHGVFSTTKENGSGIGTRSATDTVKGVDGTISFKPMGDMFCVSISMPRCLAEEQAAEIQRESERRSAEAEVEVEACEQGSPATASAAVAGVRGE